MTPILLLLYWVSYWVFAGFHGEFIRTGSVWHNIAKKASVGTVICARQVDAIDTTLHKAGVGHSSGRLMTVGMPAPVAEDTKHCEFVHVHAQTRAQI